MWVALYTVVWVFESNSTHSCQRHRLEIFCHRKPPAHTCPPSCTASISAPALGWTLALPRGQDMAGWALLRISIATSLKLTQMALMCWLAAYALYGNAAVSMSQWLLNSLGTMDGSHRRWRHSMYTRNSLPTAPDTSHHLDGPLAKFCLSIVHLSLAIQCCVFRTGNFLVEFILYISSILFSGHQNQVKIVRPTVEILR